jgi:hypothetical protein
MSFESLPHSSEFCYAKRLAIPMLFRPIRVDTPQLDSHGRAARDTGYLKDLAEAGLRSVEPLHQVMADEKYWTKPASMLDLPDGYEETDNHAWNRRGDCLAVGGYGKSPSEIVRAPNQFEPWNPDSGNDPGRFDAKSPAYRQAAALAQGVFSGVVGPIGGRASGWQAVWHNRIPKRSSVPSESDDLSESLLVSRRQFIPMFGTRYSARFDSISYGSGISRVIGSLAAERRQANA